MIKIKRKVIQHGQSTLTISLPSNWVKKFSVKKGDELNLEEYDKELRITNEKEFSIDKKQVNIGNLKRLGKSYITALYRSGCDEIHLNYDDNSYIKVIQNLLSKETTGFEIVKQGNNYCLIKDLTGHSKDEFNIALRRIWLLTLDLSKESLKAIKKKDTDTLKHIYLMDYSINKFTNYCLRLLIKKGYINFKQTPLYYHLIRNIEEIADKYKDLCNFYLIYKGKVDNNLFTNFDKINDHLNEFYELFYKYDKQRLEDLFSKTKITQNKVLISQNSMSYILFSICENIRNLLPILVEINL